MPISSRLHDFTHVDTIYQAHITTSRLQGRHRSYRLKTLRVALKPQYQTNASVEKNTIVSAKDAYDVLSGIFATLDEDHMHAVMLIFNGAYEVTGYKVLAFGAESQIHLDNKVVFKNAILLGARAILMAHNHPSGRLDLSENDVSLIQQILTLGKVIGLEILDHIIYTPKSYTSIRHTHPEIFA